MRAARESLHRHQKPRIGRIVSQRFPHLENSHAQALVKIYKSIALPQPQPNLLAGHDLAAPLKQQSEQLKRLVLQLDAKTVACERARRSIQGEEPKAIRTRG